MSNGRESLLVTVDPTQALYQQKLSQILATRNSMFSAGYTGHLVGPVANPDETVSWVAVPGSIADHTYSAFLQQLVALFRGIPGVYITHLSGGGFDKTTKILCFTDTAVNSRPDCAI